MPYADPNKAKEYNRQYKTLNRVRWKCFMCGDGYEKKPVDCSNDIHAKRYEHRLKKLAEYKRKRRQENPLYSSYTAEQRRIIEKRKMRKLRAGLLNRLGGKCQQCFNSDIRVLQVDHRHGGGGKERREKGWAYRKILLKMPLFELIEKYQLLCANCHAIKTWWTDV